MHIFLLATHPTQSQESQTQHMDINGVLYMTQNALKRKQSKGKNNSQVRNTVLIFVDNTF